MKPRANPKPKAPRAIYKLPKWSPEELELLRKLPAPEVAKLTGRTLHAVYQKRVVFGIRNRDQRGKG